MISVGGLYFSVYLVVVVVMFLVVLRVLVVVVVVVVVLLVVTVSIGMAVLIVVVVIYTLVSAQNTNVWLVFFAFNGPVAGDFSGGDRSGIKIVFVFAILVVVGNCCELVSIKICLSRTETLHHEQNHHRLYWYIMDKGKENMHFS